MSHDIAQRNTNEQIAVLELARFRTANTDLNLETGELEKLLQVVEVSPKPLSLSTQANICKTEASAEVLDNSAASEITTTAHSGVTIQVRPPSPPSSSDHNGEGAKGKQLGERERQVLLRLQEYIALKLGQPGEDDL